MRYRSFAQKLKSAGSFLLILLLLPYVATIFIQGADSHATNAHGSDYVKVRINDDGEEKILAVPWEEYFIGVLALAVPPNSEEQFLKAQAVLTRTKLYQELGSGEKGILTERYLNAEELEIRRGNGDYESYYNSLLTAMKETENQVLFYQDTYAWTPFHKSSNGMTRSAQEVLGREDCAYLGVRECPLDKEAEDEMQISTYSYKEVQVKCQPFLVAVDAAESEKTYQFEDFEILSYDSAGYVNELRIGETVCTGDQFRDALSLPSSSFSLKDSPGGLKVTTMGSGHGLGMSQWTANEMAKEGKGYEEILQFFFPETVLEDGGEIADVK